MNIDIPIEIELLPEFSKKILENFIRSKDKFENHSMIFQDNFVQRFLQSIDLVEDIIENKTFCSEKKIINYKISELITNLEVLLKQADVFIKQIDSKLIDIKKIRQSIKEYNFEYLYQQIDNIKNFFNTYGKQLRNLKMPGAIHYDLEETINSIASTRLMYSSLEQSPIELSSFDKQKILDLWQIIETIYTTASIIFKNQEEFLYRFTYKHVVQLISENQLKVYMNTLRHVS